MYFTKFAFLSVLAILYLTFTVAQRTPKPGFCNGRITLNNNTGAVTDHLGGGNYESETTCIWEIRPYPQVDSITFKFTKLDLEYNYDYVYFFRGQQTVNAYLRFTGKEIPALFEIPGPAVTIVFDSDTLVTGLGFSLFYYGNNCPGGCSGNGNCLSSYCSCDPGWTGPSCNQTECTNDCNAPNGVCVGDKCQCDTGFYGGACNGVYCDGLSVYTDQTGIFTDHRSDSEYLNQASCSWLINPAERVDSISLSFTSFDTQFGYDIVAIFDGDNTAAPLIGQFSGTNIPPIVFAFSGKMLITFSSDAAITRTGFTAVYETFNCTNSCSGYGGCYNGECICHEGHGGEDCSETVCSNNCNIHGNCTAEGICKCEEGYEGVSCSVCTLPECENQYCQQEDVLIGANEIFSSNEGAAYRANTFCNWFIEPEDGDYSGITLSFLKFDLGEGAYLAVYDGNEGYMLMYYSGSSIPPPLTSSAKTLRVEFSTSSSDQNLKGGFIAEYSVTKCVGDCSGSGVCSAENTCLCDAGYEGMTCEQTVCVNNCTNGENGDCVDNVCKCYPGFSGADCSVEYCSGGRTFRESSGIIVDHSRGEPYRPNSDCYFTIELPDDTDTISLIFDMFSTEEDHDFVTIYDGATMDSPVIGYYSGGFLPNPIISSTNALVIRFSSDAHTEYLGFSATYSATSNCPSSCSNNGFCHMGKCICNGGKTGEMCNQDAPVQSVNEYETVTGVVKDYQWQYYVVKIDRPVSQLIFEFSIDSSQGNPLFFLAKSFYPTLTDFNQRAEYFVDGSFSVKDPEVGSTYYFGIYGNSNQGTSGYIFLSYFLCPETCGNGRCIGSKCVCEECWGGYDCSLKDKACNKRVSSGDAVMIVVIVIIGALLVGAAVFYFMKRLKAKKAAGVPVGAATGPRSYAQFEDDHVELPETTEDNRT